MYRDEILNCVDQAHPLLLGAESKSSSNEGIHEQTEPLSRLSYCA